MSKSADPALLASIPQIPAAIDPKDRIVLIDILRGIALFGVLMVNLVTAFRVSIFSQLVPSGAKQGSSADRALEGLVAYALDMKAWSLFSLLFGVGLAIQFDRFAKRDHPLCWLRRRLVVLLGLGLCHLILIWNGDILTEYALAGLLVLPLIRHDKETLAFYALATFGFFVLMPLMYRPVYWPTTQAFVEAVDIANHVYPHSDFIQILQLKFHELKLIIPLLVWGFPRTIAMMLLGAWVWKGGLIQRLRTIRRKLLAYGLLAVAIGIGAKVAESRGLLTEHPVIGDMLSRLGPPVQALGYAALIAITADQPYLGRLLNVFAPLGRMAFTNYIVQSLLFSWIFMGYGLGQFNRLGVTEAFLIGSAVYIAQMIGSALWLRRFRFGPLEWLWRSLMYGQKQPMRIGRTQASELP